MRTPPSSSRAAVEPGAPEGTSNTLIPEGSNVAMPVAGSSGGSGGPPSVGGDAGGSTLCGRTVAECKARHHEERRAFEARQRTEREALAEDPTLSRTEYRARYRQLVQRHSQENRELTGRHRSETADLRAHLREVARQEQAQRREAARQAAADRRAQQAAERRAAARARLEAQLAACHEMRSARSRALCESRVQRAIDRLPEE